MKQNLERSIALTFRVNTKEREQINERMKSAGISTLRTFLLKMALNGRVINVEMDSIRECNRLLRNVSNNINQIARRVNETGGLYAADVDEIKSRQDEIWERQNNIIRTLAEIVEAV